MSIDEELKQIQIGKQTLNGVYTWIALTDDDIAEIKQVFAKHVMPDVDKMVELGVNMAGGSTEMYGPAEAFYTAFEKQLKDYVGTALETNEFDREVYNEILRRAKVAAGLQSE